MANVMDSMSAVKEAEDESNSTIHSDVIDDFDWYCFKVSCSCQEGQGGYRSRGYFETLPSFGVQIRFHQ